MVGSPDVAAIGIGANGAERPLLEDGRWVADAGPLRPAGPVLPQGPRSAPG